ncbi:MAG: AsmA-like C-terminal region-containing protein, partial [Paracoccaceae bacterium]
LSLAAPGLEAKGTLSLSDEGGLKEARFSGLKLRDWFIGDVTLTGQGPGRPIALAVTAGEADMRQIDFAAGRSGTGAAPVIDVALDRLRVSADIALDQFRGRFSFSGGMSGDFTGLINGQAPMRGTMVPAKNGRSSFRLESDDAGRALAAAGLYASGRGGTVKVVMQPRDEAATYSGTLNIRNIRVVDAPGLASLLNAVSVVGLLNELQGDGIVFSDVEARFLLTPEAVQIRKGSAVGASLGVSAEGLYRISSKSTSLQGVISPVYILNGIGQIFSRGRDGLFGFAYRYESSPAGSKATVNPLSILTPGVFRDIFRKDPPKIGE